ncbi:MAG TPA: thiamine pyrophosphate-dependent dehydrogenase E1 component subunit alpha [Xanthobacteraceae bacterium]|nr:thiamine pyrophosphate-dependent dehydrogenase E1 component subunit alpha [Xanthobacteraceae bacterium]
MNTAATLRVGRAPSSSPLSAGQLLACYAKMLRIRLVEEAIAAHYAEGEMRCPVHLSIGQEAVAVGVCEALAPTDKIYSTHRCHAHYLAKGGDLKRMFAEICGKEAGCIGGRGGSMHLMDVGKGMMASIPIVSSSIPVAVGSALADKRMRTGKVTVAFFGDASIEEGVFHESTNFASLHRLPVIFVCENNLYSVYTHLHQRQPDRPLTEVARAHAIAAFQSDGNDLEACYDLTKQAADRARGGEGPTFLLFDTYRWREHCGPSFDNTIGYRTEAEFKDWEERCPIRRLHGRLGGALATDREAAMTAEIAAEIEDARAFARSAPLPDASTAGLHVYA